MNQIWRIPDLHNLELLKADRTKQVFPRHTHEQYALGVIEHGALGFTYRGKNIVANAGEVNLCMPDYAHSGQPASPQGWSYRMLYLEPNFVASVVAQLHGKADLPFIEAGVLQDAVLAQKIKALHHCLELGQDTRLEQESHLFLLLEHLLLHHTTLRPKRFQHAAVDICRDYIHSHFLEEVRLETLARLAGLSPYHLLRVFTQGVGLPPHAYLRQIRIAQARRLLRNNAPVAQVALESGFADQSHLNRWFKRFFGITPAQYRNCVQDSPKSFA
jgi:AraC-like DNA-binding protein